MIWIINLSFYFNFIFYIKIFNFYFFSYLYLEFNILFGDWEKNLYLCIYE